MTVRLHSGQRWIFIHPDELFNTFRSEFEAAKRVIAAATATRAVGR